MIHLGTSGYVYRHWREVFYPRRLPATRWLGHYARIFSTVELNATFYRLPTAAAADGWREGTPPGFRFAAKGSRYLTHMKRLKDAGPGLDRYFELILRLQPKLSVVLWQLPPQMKEADPLRPVAMDLAHFRGDAYVYFNNDLFGHAIADAVELSSLLDSQHALRHASRPAAPALE